MCEGLPRATSIGRADGATTPHRDLPFFTEFLIGLKFSVMKKIKFYLISISEFSVRTSLVTTVTVFINNFYQEKDKPRNK